MFSGVIERAVNAAVVAHEGQTRKGLGNTPYIVHPVHIALMLARWDMDEDVIAAGLLHDVVEDCKDWTIERVETEFGKHIASIVADLTEDKSKTWAERKQAAIDNAPHLSPQAACVKAADKLHNMQSLLSELETASDPASVWSRFNGGRERTLEMDGKLVSALEQRLDSRLAKALRQTYQNLVDLDAKTVLSN